MKKYKYKIVFEAEHTGNTEMELEQFVEDIILVSKRVSPTVKLVKGDFEYLGFK